jgi:WD40 repeat protein
LFISIFKHLSLKDLLTFSMTSKRSFALIQEPMLWKNRFTLDHPSVNPLDPSLATPDNPSTNWLSLYRKTTELYANVSKGRFTKNIALVAHKKAVTFLQSANGLTISGSSDKSVKVWPNVEKDTVPLRTLNGGAKVLGFAYNKPLDKITVGFANNSIKCWEISNDKLLWEKQFIYESSGFRFVGDDICSWNDAILTLWSKDGDLKHTFRGHTKRINVSEIEGQTLFSGSVDKTLRTWDISQGSSLLTLTGHQATVSCVQPCLEEQLLVSGSSDKSTKVWDLRTGTVVHTFANPGGHVSCIKKRGAQVIVGSEDECVRVWDLRKDKFFVHKFTCESSVCSIEANWSQIAAGLKSGVVSVWSFV